MITNNISTILSAVNTQSITRIPFNRDECLSFVIANCEDALNNYSRKMIMYRGEKYHDSDMFLATPGDRISQNTSNEYTKLMSDVLDNWSEYPKRNNSFICTFDKDKALKYSYNCYIVLPMNNANIGICPSSDIWESFGYMKDLFIDSSMSDIVLNMHIFNYAVECFIEETLYIAKKYGLSDDSLEMPSFINESRSFMLSFFNSLDELVVKIIHDRRLKKIYLERLSDQYNHNRPLMKKHFMRKWIDTIINGGGTYGFLSEVLDPKANGFVHQQVNKLYTEFVGNAEMWTDSKCVFIKDTDENRNLILEAIERLKNDN